MHSASRRLLQRRLPVPNIRRITRNDRLNDVASFWNAASRRNDPTAVQTFISLSSFFPSQKIPKGFEDFFPPHAKSPPPRTEKTQVHKSNEPKSEKTPPPPPPHNNHNPNDSANIPGLIALLLFIMALRNWLEQEDAERGHEITWQTFQQQFLGQCDTMTVVNQNRVQFTTAATTADRPSQKYYFYIGSVERLEEKLAAAQQHLHPTEWVEVKYIQQTNLLLEFIKALPFLALPVAIHFGFRGLTGGATTKGGSQNMKSIFGIGKSTARKINKENVHVTFKDVAGCEQAKMEVMEFVDFLKDSDRFTKLGAKIPKGALLCGPPGTGKTLLAKAVAGESGVPFFSISGSDFIEMFVGVGPSRVRDLFAEARANAPCIVFIDEIDAVGRQRGRGGFSGGGNDERENTLNQLLVEMDGFSPTTGVVVLAGTNRVDILDQALTRPGRFDRQITVDRPDLRGRQEIFLVHLAGLTLEGPAEDIAGRLAGLTPGFAGADIANLCNEAAIVAARRKAESVTIQDFEKATDRIIGGLESNKIMSKHEREIVAHHEAGHAIAGWFLEHADPLLKVTIIPRTSGALGFAQYLPKEVFLRSPEQIMDIVCMALAGRAAEQVFFGEVTTGASDDLRRVTQLVYSMIQEFGFNNRLGQLAFRKDPNSLEKPYSDSTAEAMDDEARRIVDEAYARTVELIESKKEQVDALAQLLLEKETITHDDIVELVGARPFVGDKAYHQYVSSKSRGSPPVDEVAAEEKEDVGFDGPLTPGLA
jgi:AFG3 family protein